MEVAKSRTCDWDADDILVLGGIVVYDGILLVLNGILVADGTVVLNGNWGGILVQDGIVVLAGGTLVWVDGILVCIGGQDYHNQNGFHQENMVTLGTLFTYLLEQQYPPSLSE